MNIISVKFAIHVKKLEPLKFHYYIKYVPVLLILFIVLGGCGKKKKERKIEGTWELIDLTEPPDNDEQWVFEKQGTLRRIRLTDSLPPAGIDTGEYSIQVKLFKTFVNISGLIDSYGLNGKWEVVKVNKKIMIIVYVERTGLLQKEFIKK